MDRCAELFRQHLGVDLRTLLYPEPTSPDGPTPAAGPATGGGMDLRRMLARGRPRSAEAAELDRTLYAQPVTFMVEWALARLWTDWGIRPQAMTGYSIGEYVAACVAEVLTLEDACFLVAGRARLIEEMPGGAMLAVSLPEREAALLEDRLSVAAVNGPALTVLAGATDVVAELEERLTRDGVACRRLQTTHAFHSTMMEPGRAPYVELTRTVTLRPPRIPYLSNVTGTWITDAEATDPAYWARHMCETVRFAGAVEELWQTPGRIILEVGPGQAYSSLALQLLPEGANGDRMSLSSLPAAHDSQCAARFLLTSLGRLWLAGVEPDWDRVHAGETPGACRSPPIPSNAGGTGSTRPRPAAATDPSRFDGQAGGPGGLVLRPSWTSTAPLDPYGTRNWQPTPAVAAVPRRPRHRPADRGPAGQGRARGHHGGPGERFQQLGEGCFALVPDHREDYDELLRVLGERDSLPQTVVHLWTVTGESPQRPTTAHFDELQRRGFYSLLFLTQAWGARGADGPCTWPSSPTDCGRSPTGKWSPRQGDRHRTRHGRTAGIRRCHLAEHRPRRGRPRRLGRLDRRPPRHRARTAARGPRRSPPRPQPLDPALGARTPGTARAAPARIRDHGVYLITGGLGGIGLALAEHLARTTRARLVLVGRSPFPAREQWAALLAAHAAGTRPRPGSARSRPWRNWAPRCSS
ncbi:acyltransferase domain-containing protein [Streptomyces sp. M10(2022)]